MTEINDAARELGALVDEYEKISSELEARRIELTDRLGAWLEEGRSLADSARVLLAALDADYTLAPRPRTGQRIPLVGGTDADIRTWAQDRKLKIGRRGRIPERIRNEYEATMAS